MAERDVDAGCHELRHPGHAAALGVSVVPALQRDVDQRIGDRVHARVTDQRNQLRHVIIVHRVHRCEVRAGHATLHAQPLGVEREGFDVARQRIVGLVAVHVHRTPPLRRQLAQNADRFGAIGHRALEMRNAADHLDAHRQRALQVVEGARATQHAVLRERDQLQVEVGLHLLAHVQERLHREQPRVADVDMRANREQALRHRPVAIAKRTLDQRFLREQRLQFPPERNALEQRAAPVDARQAVG